MKTFEVITSIDPEILRAVLAEVERAKAKFPQWPKCIIQSAAIVAEESGELIRAAIQCTYEGGSETDCKMEAIQTACTALRFLEAAANGDHIYLRTYE